MSGNPKLGSKGSNRPASLIVIASIAFVTLGFLLFCAWGRLSAGAPAEATTIGWVSLAFGVLFTAVLTKSRTAK
jgi:hypothetical protein